MRIIQELPGHCSSKITEIYKHVSTRVIQSVRSSFDDVGDLRIYTPFHEQYRRNIIRVKGGENTTLLKTTFDFTEQRSFQQRLYSPADRQYKHIPAGFDYKQRPEQHQAVNVEAEKLSKAEGGDA